MDHEAYGSGQVISLKGVSKPAASTISIRCGYNQRLMAAKPKKCVGGIYTDRRLIATQDGVGATNGS